MKEVENKIEYMKEDRNCGIDLYKIICMLLVIAFHFSDHGAIEISNSQAISINWVILAICRIGGGICNIAFMLTSGYFLYQKNSFSVRNIIRLWFQVMFYSVMGAALSFVIGIQEISLFNIIKSIMPLTFNTYWYFSTYIIVYLFFPYINKLLDNLNKSQHFALCLIGVLFFSIAYTVTHQSWMFENSHLGIFITVYCIGAFLQRYKIEIRKLKLILINILLICMEIGSIFIVRIVANTTGKYEIPFTYFIWGSEKILPLTTGCALFILFKDIKLHGKAKIVICKLAPSLFGVFLLHIGWLSPLFFKRLFNIESTYETRMLIIQLIIAVLTIFIMGIVVENIRLIIFEKPLLKALNNLINNIDNRIKL